MLAGSLVVHSHEITVYRQSQLAILTCLNFNTLFILTFIA